MREQSLWRVPWQSFQLVSIMNSSHRYIPEGQGVLVGLEDPKDRVASVSEISPVFISMSHGFYQQESVPSWIFHSSLSLKTFRRLSKKGGGPILSLLWVHLPTPGLSLLHPLFPALSAPQLALMPHPQVHVCNYPPCTHLLKVLFKYKISVRKSQILTLGP